MPSFLAGAFAIAGALLALGPVLIHLLDRRRYRRVQWAAMDLLRDAAAQTRRMLRLRDILLLMLRCACVLVFGLALARPYLSGSGRAVDPRQPVHAVLIVDNSLSMSYGELRGTLLDQARTRAGEFIERLPEGSRISIVPLCGSTGAIDREAYRSPADAREALVRIEVVDRVGTVVEAIDLARDACSRVPELPAKRIVFLGDQQEVAWPISGVDAALRELPEFQIVPIQAPAVANAWIEDLRLEDDIADLHSPAVLVATIRYTGAATREAVSVSLEVDGVAAAAKIVDLVPGQSRQVRFTHQFATADEAGRQTFVPVAVTLSPDRLPADDSRFLTVPVVAALPVVFVDQYGAAGENPSLNRYGETYHLRRLLAPTEGRRNSSQPVIGVRHVTIDQLNRTLLADARLVVIAGVESPGAQVPLLREFALQGGQLLIAAGGRFSPAAWSEAGWKDGAGILPAPLDPAFVGRLPDEAAATLEPFFLAPSTMAEEFFDLGGAEREELDELYRTPVFFRAVVAKPAAGSDSENAPANTPPGKQGAASPPLRKGEPGGVASQMPQPPNENSLSWLQWQIERATAPAESPSAPVSPRSPRILASFSNGHPFLIEHRIGEGTVSFAASSVGSNWNNLPRTNAVLLFDHLLRSMLGRTLPRRNFETFGQVSLPIRAEDRRAEMRLQDSGSRFQVSGSKSKSPAGSTELLSVDALGPEQFGVVLRNLTKRGSYRLVAERALSAPRSDTAPDHQRLWEIPLSVNGPARESDLTPIDEPALRRRTDAPTVQWIGPDTPIRLEGADVRGQDLWRTLLWGTVGLLLLETVCLTVTRSRPVSTKSARRDSAE